MKSVVNLPLILVLVGLLSAGCASMTPRQQQEILIGGAIGGASGVALGAIAGSLVVGAVVGTAVGVAAGALWEEIQASLGYTPHRPLPPINPPPPK